MRGGVGGLAAQALQQVKSGPGGDVRHVKLCLDRLVFLNVFVSSHIGWKGTATSLCSSNSKGACERRKLCLKHLKAPPRQG